MPWLNIQGHDNIVEQFRERIRRGRLGSSYLFTGPDGIGKRLFARRLAQALLCPAAGDSLSACGVCASCQQVEANTHTDFATVSKPPDRTVIPIDAFVGDREHRMREGLCPWISIKPAEGGRRIAIVDDADDMSEEGANALLKTLEEPPPRSILILIGTSPQSQLPTIRSRCQHVKFSPLSAETLRDLLVAQGMPLEQATELAPLCQGSMSRAALMADPGILEFRPQWYRLLANVHGDDLERAKALLEFIDGDGKETGPRRRRLSIILDLTLEVFQQSLRKATGLPLATDDILREAVESLLLGWNWGHEGLVACMDRTLLAQRHLESNANVPTNMEAWLDDVMRIARNGPFVLAAQPIS